MANLFYLLKIKNKTLQEHKNYPIKNSALSFIIQF